jgi:hypothetical protein
MRWLPAIAPMGGWMTRSSINLRQPPHLDQPSTTSPRPASATAYRAPCKGHHPDIHIGGYASVQPHLFPVTLRAAAF